MNLHGFRCWSTITLAALILAVGLSCAQKAYLYVDYHLPQITDSLAGRSVFIDVHDNRSNSDIFIHRAKKTFEEFTGLFSLSLITPDQQTTLKGAYTLPMLFKTAFSERLKTFGVDTAEERGPNTPVFTITINQFQINLVGQKWMADISYEVSLTLDNQTTARETVTGSAENIKLVGSGGAEKVVGIIFTDMINRLDVNKLFRQANL